jgi:signal peptidase I
MTTRDPLNPAKVAPMDGPDFGGACAGTTAKFRCKVPAGHLFVMGDNRDHSDDSRYWGFVPEGDIIGRADAIWFNMDDPTRIGR